MRKAEGKRKVGRTIRLRRGYGATGRTKPEASEVSGQQSEIRRQRSEDPPSHKASAYACFGVTGWRGKQRSEIGGRRSGVKSNSFLRRRGRRDQLFDRGKDGSEFFVIFLFQTLDLAREIGVAVHQTA